MRKDRTSELVPLGKKRSPTLGDGRSSSRLETGHNASVHLGSFSYNVEIADVSETGAQLRVRQGLVPSAGQVVSLQFLNGTVVQAHVVWSHDTTVGLKFAEAINANDIEHFDELGADFYSAVLRFQLATSS